MPKLRPKIPIRVRGLSLVEIMIAMTILTVGMVGFLGSFAGISRSIRVSKARTLATNLAQEQIESLKNLSYYRLLVTTAPALATESGAGGYEYDTSIYPPENLTVGQIQFTRRVFVQKVNESTGTISPVPWSDSDTGLKQISSYVIWLENNEWRKVQVDNLRDNPNRPQLDATFSGTIRSGGVAVSGASVFTVQNLTYAANTSASGTYAFKVPAGTYDVYVQKRGYFPATVSSSVTASGTTNLDFSLTAKGVGSVQGTVYIADHLVISEVCAMVDGDDLAEYVELYNPTASAVSMYTAGANYRVDFKDTSGNATSISPAAETIYVRSSIPSHGFFLFASSPTVKGVSADAYYSTPLNRIPKRTAGGLRLVSQGVNESTGTIIDAIGWGRGSSPYGPTGYRESNGFLLTSGSGGIDSDETLERMAFSTSTHSDMDTSPAAGIHRLNGNGFDSNDNGTDWVHHAHTDNETPQNSLSTVEVPGSATPASAAAVFLDDGLSASVSANSTPVVGSFTVTNVATGTWDVIVSTNGYSIERTGVVVSIGTQTALGNIIVDQVANGGYLSGRVLYGAVPLNGITVETSNGLSDVTDTNGVYQFQVIVGTHIVTANPRNTNVTYTVEESTGNSVGAGEAKVVPDILLSQGGTIRGFISTNGIDALPNIPIVATNTATGQEVGSTLSDVYGRFTFNNMQAGVYTLTPLLETGESASPNVRTATVTAGSSVFSGTTTISNAFGTISGTVIASTQAVSTGVLIIAVSTATTIGASPPTNNSTLRSGSVVYYTGSASSDGTYSISVRGGMTYNVYAWYTTFSGTTPTTSKRSSTAAVAAGANATVNFTW